MLKKYSFDWHLLKKDILNLLPALVPIFLTFITLKNLTGAFCISRIIFGIPCPACGLTRAESLLLQGDFLGAISMNFMVIFVNLFALFYFFNRYIIKKFDKLNKLFIWLLLIVSFIYYIYRMINYFPYKEPMTYFDKSFIHTICSLINK